MSGSNWANQTVWTADNLYVMRGMNSECVDLIYADPPFNSKANYAAPIGSKAAGAEFKDTWSLSDVDVAWLDLIEAKHPALNRVIRAALSKSDKSYLIYMAARLLEMQRILKPSGSIYLHCDPTMSHYLKLVMDAIFGRGNFRNELVWKRFNFHADAKRFGAITDRLLYYAVSDTPQFNRVRVEYSKTYIQSKFTHREANGRRYRLENLNPPGGRGPVYEFQGITRPWRMAQEKLEALHAEGRIYTKSTVPQLKRYLDEMPGQAVADLWSDIAPINSQAKERTGYPTQKPLALLRRVIEASTERGGGSTGPVLRMRDGLYRSRTATTPVGRYRHRTESRRTGAVPDARRAWPVLRRRPPHGHSAPDGLGAATRLQQPGQPRRALRRTGRAVQRLFGVVQAAPLRSRSHHRPEQGRDRSYREPATALLELQPREGRPGAGISTSEVGSMTDEEQRVLIGETLESHKALRCRLACLDAKADAMADSLRTVAKVLRGKLAATFDDGKLFVSDHPPLNLKKTAVDWPTAEAIADLMAQRAKAQKSLKRIAGKLREMGYGDYVK